MLLKRMYQLYYFLSVCDNGYCSPSPSEKNRVIPPHSSFLYFLVPKVRFFFPEQKDSPALLRKNMLRVRLYEEKSESGYWKDVVAGKV